MMKNVLGGGCSSLSDQNNAAAHPLDQFIWMALTTEQQQFALGSSSARCFRPSIGPFAAVLEPTLENFSALAGVIEPGMDLTFCTHDALPASSWFDARPALGVDQMIGPIETIEIANNLEVIELGEHDLADMRALVQLTKPGPFREETHLLGRFVGIREGGRLLAMTGERMHLTGFTEVSAVCAHPDARGRGLAQITVAAISNAILQRGERPFLNVLSDNTGAIGLYKKLGFTRRCQFLLTNVRRNAVSL